MTDLVKRLDDYLTILVTEESESNPDVSYALLIDKTIDELERLQAREEKLLDKARLRANESMNLDADVAKLQARNELLEKVAEEANACITAWDDSKWLSPVPLRKVLAALKEQT